MSRGVNRIGASLLSGRWGCSTRKIGKPAGSAAGHPRSLVRPAGFFTSTNQLTELNQQVKVDGRSTLLRKKFVLRGPVRQARLYVTGLGYYEASCNGRRVGDRVLAPAKTNYRKWVLYDTYDLTAHLAPGTNALGIMLGNGWFNPYTKWWEPYRMQWFGSKRALAQLHVEYADGSAEVVASDGYVEDGSRPGALFLRL